MLGNILFLTSEVTKISKRTLQYTGAIYVFLLVYGHI